MSRYITLVLIVWLHIVKASIKKQKSYKPIVLIILAKINTLTKHGINIVTTLGGHLEFEANSNTYLPEIMVKNWSASTTTFIILELIFC